MLVLAVASLEKVQADRWLRGCETVPIDLVRSIPWEFVFVIVCCSSPERHRLKGELSCASSELFQG